MNARANQLAHYLRFLGCSTETLVPLLLYEEGGVVLWRGLCDTLKTVVWYFEEGCMVLWRGWCGTLKRVVWYFEEGCVVLWRGWCGTLKRVVWYFEEGGVVLYFFNIKLPKNHIISVYYLIINFYYRVNVIIIVKTWRNIYIYIIS